MHSYITTKHIPILGLPLAAVAWAIYGALIAVRVAITFKLNLEKHEEIGDLKLTVW